MRGVCSECGEGHDEYSLGGFACGCQCAYELVTSLRSKPSFTDGVITILDAIGSAPEDGCRHCGEKIWFVLPDQKKPAKNYKLKWWVFDATGTRHDCTGGE